MSKTRINDKLVNHIAESGKVCSIRFPLSRGSTVGVQSVLDSRQSL